MVVVVLSHHRQICLSSFPSVASFAVVLQPPYPVEGKQEYMKQCIIRVKDGVFNNGLTLIHASCTFTNYQHTGIDPGTNQVTIQAQNTSKGKKKIIICVSSTYSSSTYMLKFKYLFNEPGD